MAVTAKTYLELVNMVIQESGAELQELTSSTFATTTNPLAKNIKRWVQQAWLEIQTQNEWTWLRKDANLAIYPRSRVISVAAGSINVGDKWRGDDSLAEATHVAFEVESGAVGSGTLVGYIEYTDLTAPFKLGEYLSVYNSAGVLQMSSIVQVTGYGSYSLRNEVSDLKEPILNSFYYILPSTGTHNASVASASADLIRLPYMASVEDYYEAFGSLEQTSTDGLPRCVVDMGNGYVDLLPRPGQPVTLRFKYIAEPQSLSAYTDTLTSMIPEYQDIVAWRALMRYAKFGAKTSTFYYAKDCHDQLWVPFYHAYTPSMTFSASIYDE